MEIIKRIFSAIFDFLQGIVVILSIMVMVYLFIMSPQEINGQSMYPTFQNGEYILTNKIQYKFTEPSRGDVVIFKSPKNPDVDYIKRIIGLPGDRVKLSAGAFYINGEKLNESSYIGSDVTLFGGSFLAENDEITIPPSYYFVIGDNRPHSSDSREFGPVPKDSFIGKAFLRYWPFSLAGLVIQPHYNF
jgi:signal peptidase I